MRQPIFLAFLLLLLGVGLASAQEWMPVTPGGDAVCARGTPYTFFVRSGDPQKLLIYFEGGGACWNDATCAPGFGLFDEVVEGGEAAAYSQGIFDAGNPENPLAGYTIVFIMYCTGDYHLGTKAVDYATGTVQHVGAIDATAALDWTFANYPRPTDVVVGGCSAGAIGSIYHTPTIARRYRSARFAQFGDAGIGVINSVWGGFDVWGVRSRRTSPDQFVASLYASAARSYPRATFGEYTSYNDGVQINYYTIMGAETAWTLAMLGSLDGLQRSANFSGFVAPGGEHCITPTQRFYSEAVNGVRFRDWFAGLVSGQRVDDVRCTEC
ncbi:MAG: esterase [Anaerolineae bacterium]|nr:esterase [Anaerolineae bacterium]